MRPALTRVGRRTDLAEPLSPMLEVNAHTNQMDGDLQSHGKAREKLVGKVAKHQIE
jgi:hypothetical protein